MHTQNPLMDELAKITTAAMGLAQAASEEAKTAFRAQFDALKAEIVALRAELAALKPATPKTAAVETGAAPAKPRAKRAT